MRRTTTVAENWNLDAIPLDSINLIQVRYREDLFYLATAASFIEFAADLYSDNLATYFQGDDEVLAWLKGTWKSEETRHGRALRSYVRHAWPEFDWDAAYAAFFAEYSAKCTLGEFESTRALELVARCVVETGTATFYQMLASQSEEPVLAGIASRIHAEEVGHYKHFYRYFRKFSALESPGRTNILGAIKRRVLEARQDDADCALRHAFSFRNAETAADAAAFTALSRKLGQQVRRHYPVTLAVKMLLKPLNLPAGVARIVTWPVVKGTLWILRH